MFCLYFTNFSSQTNSNCTIVSRLQWKFVWQVVTWSGEQGTISIAHSPAVTHFRDWYKSVMWLTFFWYPGADSEWNLSNLLFDDYHHIWENLGNVLVNASLCVTIELKFRGVISGKWIEQGCNVSRPTFRMHQCLWSHRRAISEVWGVILSCWNQKTLRSVRYLALMCVQKRSSISFDHYLAIATVDPSAARSERSQNAPDSESTPRDIPLLS